mmetsp:Transcript_116/g.273  ORF Transcript_116/g.273 Transcript_116/m.273 type:complete len:338 (-) Transcript_116:459-1472(-)|eukprot:CAMPEP_0114490960 /NCGR_PEP_ID=MMETSP0109-20121206/2735_1 /TAXON_ID=29199 /ORGANISM="Chlorarachnion reptans, Strain CCCM449" /LENGTH=337 /DNA_ID=CAMNT_0001667641 /DNA_START=98 /DNA_END=1111 /DNA_ORIENTATION=-
METEGKDETPAGSIGANNDKVAGASEVDMTRENTKSKRKHGWGGTGFDTKDQKDLDEEEMNDERPSRRRFEETSTNEVNEWESKDDGDSLGDLLKTFASMAIPKNDSEVCPLCFNTFKLEVFSDHVPKCLDNMESNVKSGAAMIPGNDFSGGDCPNGANCKIATADHFRFMRHPKVECPICAEKYHMHEINAHINFCLEKGGNDSEMKDESESSAKSNSEAPQMTTQQMAACAKAILDAKEKDSGDLVGMLQRFKTLGFTRESLKNRLNEIKEDSPDGKFMNSSSSSRARTNEPDGFAVTTGFDLKPPSFTYEGGKPDSDKSPSQDSSACTDPSVSK